METAKRPVEVIVVRREELRGKLPHGHVGESPVIGERDVERQFDLQVVDHCVVIDGLIEIVPIRYQRQDPKTGRAVTHIHPISFSSVTDLIIQLKQHFPNLMSAAFDRWESSQLIEELIKKRINVQNLAFTAAEQYALYYQHRSLVYNDLVKCVPSLTRIGDTPRAEREFLDLQEVRIGAKVDHKPDGSKDSADAIVIATDLAITLSMHGQCFILY